MSTAVRELFVTLKPSPEGPCHLITTDAGTHEITRVFYFDGHFQAGWGNDRVGLMTIETAEYDPAEGLTVCAADGRTMHAPAGVIQTASWK